MSISNVLMLKKLPHISGYTGLSSGIRLNKDNHLQCVEQEMIVLYNTDDGSGRLKICRFFYILKHHLCAFCWINLINYITTNRMKNIKSILSLRLRVIPIYGEGERRYEVWSSFKDIMSPQGQMGQMWPPEHAVKHHSSSNGLAI